MTPAITAPKPNAGEANRPICALPECNQSVPPSRKTNQWRHYCCDEHAAIGKRRLNNIARTKRARAAGVLPCSYYLIDIEEVRRLAADGLTTTQISDALKREWSSISRCATRNGISIKREAPYRPLGDKSDLWESKSRDELLVSLFSTELSYSEIAAEITRQTGETITKNAVVGRLHRLGLTGLRGPQKEAPPRVEFPPPGHCLYAHGENPHYDFCGLRAEPGSSWCLAHHRVVFKPASPIDMRGAA